ncbi:MAG: TetR family transcriptional regulator [Proteobacteria bacterium]|nr:TetR family transcriptional regulator [Pseudomonadota bacterium]
MDDFADPPVAQAPEKKLLLAAIQQIEAHGMARVTVRGIAAAAGMNLAAVNYYFRSKNALMQAALATSLEHMRADTERYLHEFATDPQAALKALLLYYFEGSVRYPRVTKAHLHDAFTQDDYRGQFPRVLEPIIVALRDRLAEAVPGLSRVDAAHRVATALSAVFFPALFRPLYGALAVLETERQRQAYFTQVAAQALAPPSD